MLYGFYVKAHRRDGLRRFAELELVQHGGFACVIETQHQDTHLAVLEEARLVVSDCRMWKVGQRGTACRVRNTDARRVLVPTIRWPRVERVI